MESGPLPSVKITQSVSHFNEEFLRKSRLLCSKRFKKWKGQIIFCLLLGGQPPSSSHHGHTASSTERCTHTFVCTESHWHRHTCLVSKCSLVSLSYLSLDSQNWKGTSRLSDSITHLTLSLHRNDTKIKTSCPAPRAPQFCEKLPRHGQEDRVFPPLMLIDSV